MLQSFFTGVAGMIVFSRTLDTISDNVANLNTPGYKGNDLFYKSLGSANSSAGGARVAGEFVRQSTGDIRETGNPTDLALLGKGQFVISVDGKMFYTRGGQFFFDEEGLLRDSISDGLVMALGENGQLIPVDISSLRTRPPTATTEIEFTGNLSTGDPDHSVENVIIFNSLGEEVSLDFRFTNNTSSAPGEWLVSVENKDGVEIWTGQVVYGIDGSPEDGFSELTLTIPGTSNGTTGEAVDITLNFGAPGDLSGSTSFSGGTVSTLGGAATDGGGVEGIVAVSISEDGNVRLLYTNGDTEEPYRLALAEISDERQLRQASNGLYELPTTAQFSYGYADSGGLGSIASESLESSNIDLVREFAELIIAQRGYQASSHVMDISNQLIDTLYNATQQ